MKPERPAGVTAVAIVFLLTAAYLLAVGLTMLARPGLISMAAGAELLGGLELAGPYMFLLTATVGGAVTLGLWRLHKWARWMAILIAMIGMVLLLPSVSSVVPAGGEGSVSGKIIDLDNVTHNVAHYQYAFCESASTPGHPSPQELAAGGKHCGAPGTRPGYRSDCPCRPASAAWRGMA